MEKFVHENAAKEKKKLTIKQTKYYKLDYE